MRSFNVTGQLKPVLLATDTNVWVGEDGSRNGWWSDSPPAASWARWEESPARALSPSPWRGPRARSPSLSRQPGQPRAVDGNWSLVGAEAWLSLSEGEAKENGHGFHACLNHFCLLFLFSPYVCLVDFSLICLCSLFHGIHDQAVKSSQAIISQVPPSHVCKSLCLIVLVPISVLCCILMLVPAFVCVCVWVSVSLCLCCCLSCVFTSFLEKKTDVFLCAPVLLLSKVITCIAAVQISLFADCCQQPMSPSRPTYIY